MTISEIVQSWGGKLTAALVVGVFYFLMFPDDLAPVTTAFDGVLHLARGVIALSEAVPLGLYILGSAGVVGFTAHKIWARPTAGPR